MEMDEAIGPAAPVVHGSIEIRLGLLLKLPNRVPSSFLVEGSVEPTEKRVLHLGDVLEKWIGHLVQGHLGKHELLVLDQLLHVLVALEAAELGPHEKRKLAGGECRLVLGWGEN